MVEKCQTLPSELKFEFGPECPCSSIDKLLRLPTHGMGDMKSQDGVGIDARAQVPFVAR